MTCPLFLRISGLDKLSPGVWPGVAQGVPFWQTCDSQGAATIFYPYYLAFGREMWKLTNRVSGESAAMEAAILVAKWVARGLALSVLEAIRTEVFNVGPPAGP